MKVYWILLLSSLAYGGIIRGSVEETELETVEDGYTSYSHDSEITEVDSEDSFVPTPDAPVSGDTRNYGSYPGGRSEVVSHGLPRPYHRGHGNWTGRRIARAVDSGLNELQVSSNCRTVVAINVADPVICSKIKQGDLLKFNAVYSPAWGSAVTGSPHDKEYGQANPGQYTGFDPNWLDHYGNLDISNLPGRCRYDPFRAQQDPTTACLCVATQETCTLNRDGCYWYDDLKTGYKECISKAEKFYNQLYALLRKRGKKSFAINIKYGATGARGELPLGPYGPAIIGAGNPDPSTTLGIYKQPAGTQPYPAKPTAYGSTGGSIQLPSQYGTVSDYSGSLKSDSSGYQSSQSNLYQPNQPNLYQPNQPNLYQPTQPNLYQPSLPNMNQPTQSNIYEPNQPNQPSMYRPNQPNQYQPNQPNMYQPNQLGIYQPNLPNMYQPSTYQPNQPNQPSMYQPNHPNMYQPNHPNMYQPNHPNLYQPNQLSMFQPNQPNHPIMYGQSQSMNPGFPTFQGHQVNSFLGQHSQGPYLGLEQLEQNIPQGQQAAPGIGMFPLQGGSITLPEQQPNLQPYPQGQTVTHPAEQIIQTKKKRSANVPKNTVKKSKGSESHGKPATGHANHKKSRAGKKARSTDSASVKVTKPASRSQREQRRKGKH